MTLDWRLGIDVGGTNTDAVVIRDDGTLVAWAKRPTTPDVDLGIAHAVSAVFADEAVDASRLTHAMLGTTHTTNALLQRRGLTPSLLIRISSPAGHSVPPLYGWPPDLADAACAAVVVVRGGHEYDGREIVPFDAEALERFLRSLDAVPACIAIVGAFSPVCADHELAAARIVRDVFGETPRIFLSHEISSLGFLERESATLLNAALADAAAESLRGLESALDDLGLGLHILFAQNDGSLMSIEQAIRRPVLTIGSGPSNSIRGAGFLTGTDTAIVVDVGGTSTDVGVLTNGFPRESYAAGSLAGVRTNFRLPDIVTIALGGGTVVRGTPEDVHLGPDSVGYRLTREALVFGGRTPTLTDAAVWCGRARLGDRDLAAPYADLLEAALAASDLAIAEAVDSVKTSRAPMDLIAVGGGSLLIPPTLDGVGRITQPDHHDVANAIGAATAAVTGEVDSIINVDSTRAAALTELKEEAKRRAIEAGADPASVEVIDVDEVPLTYMFTPTQRVRVRAAGAFEHG